MNSSSMNLPFSRQHAQAIGRSGVFEIRDLGPTNGTFVNGRRVDGPVRIRAEDEIRFGGVNFDVRDKARTQPPRRFFLHTSIVVALLLALSAVSSQFVKNLLELLDGADSVTRYQSPAQSPASLSSIRPQLTKAASSRPIPAPTVAMRLPSPATTNPPVLHPSWLALLNRCRELAHLPPFVDDPKLSQADRLHTECLVRNFPEAIRSGAGFGAAAHREDLRRPNYTDEGARGSS